MLSDEKIVFILLVLLFGAAISDTIRYQIPNWLIVVGIIAGTIGRICCEGLPGLWSGVIGLGIALLLFFPLFLIRAFGAGDVKLLMMVGVWYGSEIFIVLMVAVLVAGILAVVKMILCHNLSDRVRHLISYIKTFFSQIQKGMLPEYEKNGPKSTDAVPFAVAVWLSILLHEGGCF